MMNQNPCKNAKTLSPEILIRMNLPESNAFYRKFLESKIDGKGALPAWLLPKLVADDRIEKALSHTGSAGLPSRAKEDGESLEWTAILLEHKFKATQSLWQELDEKRIFEREESGE